jgi:hypothetical protein
MDEPTQDNKPPTESNLAHVDQRQILYLDSQHSKYLPPSQYMKDISGFMAQNQSNLAHVDQRQILYLDSQHSKYLPPSQYMKDVSGFMAQNLASRPQKDGKADKPPTHEYLVHNLPHSTHSTGAIESKGNPPFPKRCCCLINKVPAGSIAAQEKKNCFVGRFNGAAVNDQSVVEHPIPQGQSAPSAVTTTSADKRRHEIISWFHCVTWRHRNQPQDSTTKPFKQYLQ